MVWGILSHRGRQFNCNSLKSKEMRRRPAAPSEPHTCAALTESFLGQRYSAATRSTTWKPKSFLLAPWNGSQ
jgi:hypothetical protein